MITKKNIFTMLLLAAIISSCDIRKKDTSTKALLSEKNKIDSPTTVQLIDSIYDFGKVKEGEIVEYNFRFKNNGNYPLIIQDAVASCGCTVPEKPDHPIAIGEIGFIKVKFNSDRRPGEAHKSITITSNAIPEFPTLYIKGTVLGKENQ